MKANVPEKIWIDTKNDLPKLSGHIDKDSVEYIRKDAFIEKAADYIKKDMLDNLAFQGRLNRNEIIDGIVERFIKAQKGE